MAQGIEQCWLEAERMAAIADAVLDCETAEELAARITDV